MAKYTTSVRLNFGGTQRYRSFPFLPRVGDRINVSDHDTAIRYSLEVAAVSFDDNDGNDEVEVIINCDVVQESSIGAAHHRLTGK